MSNNSSAGTQAVRSNRDITGEDVTTRSSSIGNVLSIWNRELDAYFRSPIAWVFVCIFLIASSGSLIFYHGFFERQEVSLELYFSDFRWLLLLLIPVLTMGLWAKERKSGTVEVLLTLPISNANVVLGKFFAALQLLFIALLFTVPIPLLTQLLLTAPGQGLDLLSVAGSYLGTLLFGAALLSIGIFISSLVRDQIVAVILTFLMAGTATFMGHEVLLDQLHNTPVLQNAIPPLEFLALGTHLRDFAAGLFPLDSLMYFLAICSIFLFLTNNNLRSWKYTE